MAYHADGAVLWIDQRGNCWTTHVCFSETGVTVGKRREGFPV